MVFHCFGALSIWELTDKVIKPDVSTALANPVAQLAFQENLFICTSAHQEAIVCALRFNPSFCTWAAIDAAS